jgi:hypothetical protein
MGCHAQHVSSSVVGADDHSCVPEAHGPLRGGAAHGEAARRRVTVIGGETEVPGGGRALTSHSSGRGDSAGALFSGANGIRDGVAPRRLVPVLGVGLLRRDRD